MTLNAQPGNDELFREAKRAFKLYIIDPSGNRDKLQSARKQLDELAKKSDQTRNPEVQLLTGDVYLTLADVESILGSKQEYGTIALAASRAYRNAYIHTLSATDITEALKGLEKAHVHLFNASVGLFEKKDFSKAFPVMEATLQVHDLLSENSRSSAIERRAYVDYIGAVSYAAQQLRNYAAAEKYLNLLIKKEMATGETYDDLMKVREAAGNKSGAEAILKEGRKLFPDHGPLIFSEINLRMSKGQYAEMPPLLKKAIELEPDNYALLHTLGSVNERLWQAALSSGDAAQANSLFGEAVIYYELATKKDPKNQDYWYSAGALYFNKAAMLSKQFSEEGTEQKMKQQKEEMLGLFRKALPFFQKAESLAPNDINALIALKTIYSYLEDPLMSEFSRRLKTVEGGGSNKTAYFKN